MWGCGSGTERKSLRGGDSGKVSAVCGSGTSPTGVKSHEGPGLVSEMPRVHLEAVLLTRARDPAPESGVTAPMPTDPPLVRVPGDQKGRAGTQQGRCRIEQTAGAGGKVVVAHKSVCSRERLCPHLPFGSSGNGSLWVEGARGSSNGSAQVCRHCVLYFVTACRELEISSVPSSPAAEGLGLGGSLPGTLSGLVLFQVSHTWRASCSWVLSGASCSPRYWWSHSSTT